MRPVVLALAAACLLVGCDPRASIGPRIGDAIREQENGLIAAVQAEDAAAVAAFYAPDAQLINPGAAPATTPEAVLASFQQLFADPNGALTFATEDVILPSSGDYAVTEGTFTVTYSNAQGQPESASGRYITLWRHQDDDSWKIMRDIATPGPAAAPAAPATP